MSVKIFPFKKGDPVPEWALSCSVKGMHLLFLRDVTLVKNLSRFNRVGIYPERPWEESDFNTWQECEMDELPRKSYLLVGSVDRRQEWMKARDYLARIFLRRKVKYRGGPTKFFNEPFVLGVRKQEVEMKNKREVSDVEQQIEERLPPKRDKYAVGDVIRLRHGGEYETLQVLKSGILVAEIPIAVRRSEVFFWGNLFLASLDKNKNIIEPPKSNS